jgi:putative ABC transport system substrate-binding protein
MSAFGGKADMTCCGAYVRCDPKRRLAAPSSASDFAASIRSLGPKRREFITLIASTAFWPTGARAQRSERLRRIGLLVVEGIEPIGPFRDALNELGYVEGRNIQIETRSAHGQESWLPQLAADFVRDQVDIIVAVQTPAAHAAKNATRDIPIVVMAGDPIATGLISNLARPGGNLTGMSATAAEAAAKSLELIAEIVPGARRVGVLGNAEDPFMKPFFEQIEQGAQTVRLEIYPVAVRDSDQWDDIFASLARKRAEVVMIQGSLPLHTVAKFALKYRLPSLSTQKSGVKAGVLMAYTASFAERARVMAGYVDQIFKGAKPADLPVQQPTRFELTINLKTAKALGLTVPPTLLARADEVIE